MDFSVLTPKRINDIKLTKHVRYAAKYVCPQVFCFDGAVLTVGLSQLMEAPAASGMDFTGSWLKVGDDAKQN
ncbi:hypothetical protein FOTG_18043 [Fusarium oxysporum f. sp. vasinfectum 25433]|uniref:Uncharacterized protein n=1 Tax=Fusarium oxysporum f. sp. vasinfectum 25433 TaxID=1089449 RepID=X0LYH4_FUSOX|nr:hypothetical protein FOTG_18043 [Fusarium oxysporum f. sp. vasinfectum 25433]